MQQVLGRLRKKKTVRKLRRWDCKIKESHFSRVVFKARRIEWSGFWFEGQSLAGNIERLLSWFGCPPHRRVKLHPHS